MKGFSFHSPLFLTFPSNFFFFFIRKMGSGGMNWKQKMCNRAQSSPRKWAMALGSRGLTSPTAAALEGAGPASLSRASSPSLGLCC